MKAKTIIIGILFAAMFSCRQKDNPPSSVDKPSENTLIEKKSTEVTIPKPGLAEVQMIREFNKKAIAEKIKEKTITEDLLKNTDSVENRCLSESKMIIKMTDFKQNYAVFQTERFHTGPGYMGCTSLYILLNYNQEKWNIVFLNKEAIVTQPRLADINNDGKIDVILFRHYGNDGPSRLIHSLYMSNDKNELVLVNDPLLKIENCSRDMDVTPEEFLNFKPCHVEIPECGISFDCKLNKFVPRTSNMRWSTTDGLQMRESADQNSKLIQTLKKDTPVLLLQEKPEVITITGVSGKWTKVQLIGRYAPAGWVFGGFLTDKQPVVK